MLSPIESAILALATALFAFPLVFGLAPKTDEKSVDQLRKVRR